MIISGGGILLVPAITNHNRKNPATGSDHRIIASTVLPFSGVFPPETTAFPRVPFGNPRNRDQNHCPGFGKLLTENFGFIYRSAREHQVMVSPNKGGHVALPSDIEIKKELLQSLIREVAQITKKEPDEVRDILFD